MSNKAKARVPIFREEVGTVPVCLPGGCRMYPWSCVGSGGRGLHLPAQSLFAPGYTSLGSA